MMKSTKCFALFALAMWIFFSTTGCSGCDDTAGGSVTDEDAGWSDVDVGPPDTGPEDVGDADAAPDATAPDTDTDTGPTQEPCDEEGATRPCGTDVGECQKGEQHCFQGYWTNCIGEVGPRPEQCSGLDESCTGEADDGDEMCTSPPSPCVGNGQCVDGSCEYEEVVDCSHLDGPCTVGKCEMKSGTCREVPREDGISCDDGDYCTVDGVCQEGQCVGAPRDCSDAADECNEGVCDSDLEACVPSPVSDGTSCDDGLFCTVNTVCQDGQCEGSIRSCPSTGNPCTDAVCDLTTDSCEPEPVADDTPCDNGLFCTVDDSCQDGICQAGQPRNCADAEGSCQSGVCDEASNSCLGDPVADGTSCDDGSFCTVETECVDGQCTAGQPRDCSDVGDQCNEGVCDETASECVPEPVDDGTTCDDGQYCTVNNVCIGGSCSTGQPRDCSHLDDQCNEGYCSESSEACLADPANVGSSCDDDLFCTVDTVCTSDGTCEGQPRDCSYLDDQCEFGVCDEASEACVANNEPDGTTCDDDLYCTVDNACVDGVCDGDPRDCSYLEDECHVDAYCDETNETCEATNICDPCEELPTADPGSDQEVSPNTLIELDGTGSSDPNGQDLDYQWTIEDQPDGSSASLDDPNSATPSIMGDVAGEFVICLTVTNEDDCDSEQECMTAVVEPDEQLHIELTWDPTLDYDVHYRVDGYPWFDREMGWPPGQNADCGDPDHQSGAVWFCVSNPDWGGGDGGEADGNPDNDPVLDIDSLEGEEPENINQDELFDGLFQVGVHLYNDYGNQPTDARLRVYVDGEMVFEEFHTIECGQMWEVADIEVSNDGTVVDVSSLNKQVLDADDPEMDLSVDGC